MISITIIVDDRAGPSLMAEHGLALWVEAAGKRILFDTGQGGALLANAQKLGVDLSSADAIVLSHGHYDHTGGLAAVLPMAVRAKVYLHPSAYGPKYSVRQGADRFIGMPQGSISALSEAEPGRVIRLFAPQEIAPDIGLTGTIPRSNDFEEVGGSFYLDPNAEKPDNLEDDLALWTETPTGLVIITGCAHSGVMNTVRYILKLNRHKRISSLIGGFHLAGAEDGRLEKIADGLKGLSLSLVAAGHCTGERETEYLSKSLGGIVRRFHSGMRIEI